MYPALALWIWNEAVQKAIVNSCASFGDAQLNQVAPAKTSNITPLLPMAMRIRLDHLRDANHSLLTATRFGADRYRSM